MADNKDIENQKELNSEVEKNLSFEEEILFILNKRRGIEGETLRDQQDINNVLADQTKQLKFQIQEKRIITSLSNNHYYSSSAYQSSVAGNVFYRSGQVVISSPLPKYHDALQDKFNIEYKSARTIYENEVLVKVPKADCNVSMNPSLRKPKSQLIQNQFTGSAWKPYITTIGLYNDSAELIAVAKLGRAVQKRDDVDMNFLVRWDY